jgi:hypothetical protein
LRAVTAAFERRLAPMAIRTANNAFVDLCSQGLNRRTTDDQTADIAMFRTAHVIKVEYNNVTLVAIHARVLRQLL